MESKHNPAVPDWFAEWKRLYHSKLGDCEIIQRFNEYAEAKHRTYHNLMKYDGGS